MQRRGQITHAFQQVGGAWRKQRDNHRGLARKNCAGLRSKGQRALAIDNQIGAGQALGGQPGSDVAARIIAAKVQQRTGGPPLQQQDDKIVGVTAR